MARKGWSPYVMRLLEVPKDVELNDDFRTSKRGVVVLQEETVNMFSSFGPRSKPEKLMNEWRKTVLDTIAKDDIKVRNTVELIYAIQREDFDQAEKLISVSDLKACNSQALREAVTSDVRLAYAMEAEISRQKLQESIPQAKPTPREFLEPPSLAKSNAPSATGPDQAPIHRRAMRL